MEKTIGRARRWVARMAGLVAVATLAACGGGGGGDAPPQGTVRMSMIDASCDYRNVFVNVKMVRLQKSPTAAESDGGWIDIVPAGGSQIVDLLSLTNRKLLDLGAATVDAGTYSQLRLVLEDTGNEVVLEDGTRHVLKTPSAQQSGLKIKANYTVAADTTTDYLLDFDACKSIVVAGNSGQWILKPVVRLTAKFTGAIEGYVDTAGLDLANTSVYAELPTGEVERTAIVDSTGKFVLPYLSSGTYTVVVTSDLHQTGVVTSVPVGTSTTAINASDAPLLLGPSAMATVTGTVTNASVIGAGGTATVDAQVTATQALTDGTTITVRSVNVLSTDPSAGEGTYAMSLPTEAPAVVAYSTPTLGALTTDAAVADTYTLTATSPGKTPVSHLVQVLTQTVVDFLFP